MQKKISFMFLWLSLICVIVFILQQVFYWFTGLFVLNLYSIYEFQVWRFVTSIFLHASVLHLLYNLFALLFFGFILERMIGSRNFLIVFFSSGIFANIISVNFYSSSLGASGAIYGILGALAILNPMMIVFSFSLIMPMFLASILWIAGDVIGLFVPSDIGHIAHISGAIIGVILALTVYLKHRVKNVKKDQVIIPDSVIEEWEDRFVKPRS